MSITPHVVSRVNRNLIVPTMLKEIEECQEYLNREALHCRKSRKGHIKSKVHSFICSFIQQILIECLLWTRPCSRCQGYSNGQNKAKS